MKRLVAASAIAIALSPVAAAQSENVTSAATIVADAPQPWQPEDGDEIRFEVFRQGDKEFGTHVVTFDVQSEGNFTVVSDVDLKAGLGPITMFRYSLDATETWKDGKLVALEGTTNDDGDDKSVTASLDGDALLVNGSAYSGNAPAGIIPSSHWNMLQAYSTRILSTESGELLDTEVTRLGEETLTIDGQSVPTTRYRLKSDLTVDLWYDDQGRWVQLSFEARGQKIDYRLQSLY